jgi:crotonobetaine/carnitine-CoA ligase
MEHCANQLVPSKRPRRIEVVDELPRTSVGKIRKFMLTASEARS